jgi:hypothetical protein
VTHQIVAKVKLELDFIGGTKRLIIKKHRDKKMACSLKE